MDKELPQHFEGRPTGTLHDRNLPHRVIEQVWMWSVFSEEKNIDFNGFLVQTGENEAFMVDPVCASPEVLESFRPLPAPAFIVITNRDHERAAECFQQHFKIPVYAHELDAPLFESLKIDRNLADGDMLPGEWRVIHLPNQKSPGECALYHANRQLLLLGDALIGKPMQFLSMLPDEKYADKTAAIEGLRALTALQVKTVLTADGDPVFQNAESIIRDALIPRGS